MDDDGQPYAAAACEISQKSVNEAITTPVNERIKHKKLWFEDGSVILATTTMLFRVYRGMLALHSPIFRDMFSLPQAVSNDDSTMEGLPVVELHDDPLDLERFLEALFDRSFYNHIEPTQFHLIISILRVSTKYEVTCLRQQTLSHLLRAFPSTLSDHDRRLGANDNKVIGFKFSTVIQSCRELNVPLLLPLGFYRFVAVLNKCDEDTGGLARVLTALGDSSREDAVRLYYGREQLRMAATKYAKFLTAAEPMLCDSDICSRAKSIILNSMLWKSVVKSGNILNVKFMERLRDVEANKFCLACKPRFLASMEEGRRTIWDELPGYFGLDSWEILRANTPDLTVASTSAPDS